MIFILGGKGFVGSAFARYCERNGLEHRVIDLEEYDSFKGERCEILINANGNSKKFLAEREPLREFDASTRSVRASLVDFRADRYVFVSSCDVYPDCSSPEKTREETPLDPAAQSPYGFHKHLAELCVRHAAPSWLIFRMGGFVGPGLRKNPVFDILFGERLWLSPESELQFLDTDRAAEAVFRVLDAGADREIFNLSGRGVVRLEEVMEWAGREVPVVEDARRVRYEVSLDKVSRLVDLPSTREVVKRFVEGHASRKA